MAKNNDKGLITWIFTIVVLVLSLGALGAFWGGFTAQLSDTSIADAGSIILLIFAILELFLIIYLWWHGIMILIGKGTNTWTFIIAAFLGAAIIGGVLMLIAKLLN